MSSQYQVSYSEIEKGICYYLTTTANKGFTSIEILNNMLSENICPELNSKIFMAGFKLEFQNKCNDTSKKFPKIKKNGDYYTFSTEKPIDLELIKEIASSPLNYPTVEFDKTYADGQTILHILSANGLYQYIEIVSNFAVIDPHMKNDNGQTLFDVIPSTPNGHQTFKTLFNIFLTQEHKRTEFKLKSMKEDNANLMKKNEELISINFEMLLTNKKLIEENERFSKEITDLKSILKCKNWSSLFETSLIVLLLAYIIYNN